LPRLAPQSTWAACSSKEISELDQKDIGALRGRRFCHRDFTFLSRRRNASFAERGWFSHWGLAMRISFLCSVSLALVVSGAALAEGDFPATLAGHAVLPAQSFIDAPADAPVDLKTSGKYTTGRRIDAVGSVMGKSYERPTGVSIPFQGPAAAGPLGHQEDG
jgi:hypothetical protein